MAEQRTRRTTTSPQAKAEQAERKSRRTRQKYDAFTKSLTEHAEAAQLKSIVLRLFVPTAVVIIIVCWPW